MSYESVVTWSQISSLVLFIGLFLIVIGYVLWPKNRDRLEAASRAALDLDKGRTSSGGRK
jgi:cbb3-type cytochrome oxidase subunit 3